ncbi:hypothetical protein HDC90_002642 [Pedobacter sp. AK013]|nr:hypothetical protein [Pedobacter sp. AK013]
MADVGDGPILKNASGKKTSSVLRLLKKSFGRLKRELYLLEKK